MEKNNFRRSDNSISEQIIYIKDRNTQTVRINIRTRFLTSLEDKVE